MDAEAEALKGQQKVNKQPWRRGLHNLPHIPLRERHKMSGQTNTKNK
jgi:hypothetical protein